MRVNVVTIDGGSGHHLFYTVSYEVGHLWWKRTVEDRVAVNGSYVCAESMGWRETPAGFSLAVIDAVKAINVGDDARRLYRVTRSTTEERLSE